METLAPETFLAGVEMIQQQLRVKREDRWSTHICKLKFVSFQSEFPEVNDAQFFWACEQWIQNHNTKNFPTFPTWKQLMTPLYSTENNEANRSWGFKRDLPQLVAPSDAQKSVLPATPRSIAGTADPLNPDAYVPFESDGNLLPAPSESSEVGLTREEWAAYLRRLSEEVNAASD